MLTLCNFTNNLWDDNSKLRKKITTKHAEHLYARKNICLKPQTSYSLFIN